MPALDPVVTALLLGLAAGAEGVPSEFAAERGEMALFTPARRNRVHHRGGFLG